MLKKRIIPCLDVKDGRVVKGVNFVQLRDAGDPVEIAKKYDEAKADEIVFLDITASHEQRSIFTDVVKATAAQVFMPLTVGGGIRTVKDIQDMIVTLKNVGIGVIITDHNVKETLKICDRAYIIHQGVVIEEGTPEDVIANDQVRSIYVGKDFVLN